MSESEQVTSRRSSAPVDAGAPTLPIAIGSCVEEYNLTTLKLVAGDGGFAWGCGYTQRYDGSIADQWIDAFAG